jgi:hypothetical protein
MAALPVWGAGTFAAVALVCCLIAFRRAGYEGITGVVARVALIVIGAGATWVLIGASAGRDVATERQALDARLTELTAHAIAPGSALACLDAAAGAAVEDGCEKAVFATPEATAAAVSYIAARLALLADATRHAQRDPGYGTLVTQLRRSAETDRFGIVAHVLAAREGCTPQVCDAFTLLKDTVRVRAHMTDRTYESHVEHYAAGWPAAGPAPVAATSTPEASLTSASNGRLPLKPPGPDVFFPSADSIPPVSIMNAEPPAAPPAPHHTTTGSTTPVPKPAARKPAPPPTPNRPVDLNAEAVRAAPAQ